MSSITAIAAATRSLIDRLFNCTDDSPANPVAARVQHCLPHRPNSRVARVATLEVSSAAR
jgi:hypothetical protein